MSARANLKPCPFCGGEAGIAGLKPHLYVRCHCCGCEGPVLQTMPDAAIAAWNRRTPEPGTRVLRDGQPDDFTREQAAKIADGWETNAADQDYMTCGNGKFWDAGTIYDLGRADAAAAIRAMGEKP